MIGAICLRSLFRLITYLGKLRVV